MPLVPTHNTTNQLHPTTSLLQDLPTEVIDTITGRNSTDSEVCSQSSEQTANITQSSSLLPVASAGTQTAMASNAPPAQPHTAVSSLGPTSSSTTDPVTKLSEALQRSLAMSN